MRNTLLKPILSLSVLMGAGGCFTQGYAEDIVIVDGLWKISYIENDHAFRVNVLNENVFSHVPLQRWPTTMWRESRVL